MTHTPQHARTETERNDRVKAIKTSLNQLEIENIKEYNKSNREKWDKEWNLR